jgi:hypothetical protein
MFYKRVVEKYYVFYIHFFPEKCVVHEIMWKNVVEQCDLHAG